MAVLGFDRASAMKSPARNLKEDIAPNAIYVHCSLVAAKQSFVKCGPGCKLM